RIIVSVLFFMQFIFIWFAMNGIDLLFSVASLSLYATSFIAHILILIVNNNSKGKTERLIIYKIDQEHRNVFGSSYLPSMQLSPVLYYNFLPYEHHILLYLNVLILVLFLSAWIDNYQWILLDGKLIILILLTFPVTILDMYTNI